MVVPPELHQHQLLRVPAPVEAGTLQPKGPRLDVLIDCGLLRGMFLRKETIPQVFGENDHEWSDEKTT